MPERSLETRADLRAATEVAERVSWRMSDAICDYFDALDNDPVVPTNTFAALAQAQYDFDTWRGLPVRHASVVRWKDATDD